MAAKILFIGIDAADKDLILQWTREGFLPTFRSLQETGLWGATTNPEGLYVGAVWPSFLTGVCPAKHGRYCYDQVRTGTYDLYPFTPYDLKWEPFWETLSRANKKVAVVDVPKSFPAASLNGLQVVDWGSHDRDLSFCASPPELVKEIEETIGPYPLHLCDGNRRTAEEFIDLRDRLISGINKKQQLIEYFLARDDWDLLLAVFGEGQCIGHQCWHLHDSTHPRHDREIARSIGNPIKDVYVALDSAIGRLLSGVGTETVKFVFTSHGMGPHYDATFLLDDMLSALEKSKVSANGHRAAKILDWGWTQLPKPIRRFLKPARVRVRQRLGEALPLFEVGLRKCYPVPNNDVYGGIRINVAGREPYGCIVPGRDYDHFCEELRRDLLSFINCDTGDPLVRQVLRTRDLYSGKYLKDLPDLMIEWNRESPICDIESPKTGPIRGIYNGTRTGDHRPDGLFFAVGPKLPCGPIRRSVSVMDFAPTIASLLGVSLDYTDGRCIPGLAPQAWLQPYNSANASFRSSTSIGRIERGHQ